VVEVGVGQHHGLDVLNAAPELLDRLAERVPGARDAGIHDRQPAVVLDEVPVGVGVLYPVDALGYVRVEHGHAALPGAAQT
jgi:hypothetical protein